MMIALNIGALQDEAEADLRIEGGAAAPEETRPLYRLRVCCRRLAPVLCVRRRAHRFHTDRRSDSPPLAAWRAAEARLPLAISGADRAGASSIFTRLLRVPLTARADYPMPW